MKNIKIVNYDNKYAEAIAVMWQNSADGWMGETFMTTAEEVIIEEEKSIHLHAWLALDGNLVVGYCNLYVYQEDTGALYIGLLNVRDDYHGKKIGKKLVLTAVDKTIELGWDRLDLYTWSGNIKAVPLYKKTGFFWEDRDDSTHLINFIPSILKNELVKDYFKDIDWYKDSIRKIEVVPDGRKENEFEYLEYSWKKGKIELSAEYCRRGRGLRKLETDEYVISVTVEDLKLVFGSKYKIRYDLVNKTDKPLKFKLLGVDDKNISFNLNKEFTVNETKSFKAEFMVNEIDKEQNVWKTHPCVATEISVGGKKAQFRVGIEPRFPAKLVLRKKSNISYPGTESEIFLNIENSFEVDTVFQFTLPKTKEISFIKKKFVVAMKAKEKRSIKISYILQKGCVYSEEIKVTALRKGCEQLTFKRRIDEIFHTMTDRFHGSIQNVHLMGNGVYQMFVSYRDFFNIFRFGSKMSNDNWVAFHYPKLGKPYSDEFNKKACDKVEYEYKGTAILQRCFYKSDKFKGILFQVVHKLFPNGLVEHWMEFENNGYSKTDELIFMDSFGLRTKHLEIPFKGNIIKVEEDVQGGTGNWDTKNIDENWIFTKNKNSTIGVCWSDENKINFGSWNKFFEYDLEKLKIGQKLVTKPIVFGLNVFADSHQLREFAQQKKLERLPEKRDLEFSVNKGNPFVDANFEVKVVENKKKNWNGIVKVDTPEKTTLLGKFSEKEPVFELSGKLTYSENRLNNTIIMKSELNDLSKLQKRTVFLKSKSPINHVDKELEGNKVLQISNGVLSISASVDFAPSLFSMKFMGQEWLDSSFPIPSAKSWWKPWIGGIYTVPNHLRIKTVMKEKSVMKQIRKEDNLGNVWEGISITTSVQENEKYRGLVFEQLFLLLPGVPVMLHTTRILQNTGRLFVNEPIETGHFFKPEPEIKDCRFISANRNGEKIVCKAGGRAFNYEADQQIVFAGENTKEFLQVYGANSKSWSWLCPDNQVLNAWIGDNITCEADSEMYIGNRFYIFTEEILEQEMMRDLKNIRFED